jgi:thiol:disulfide interchange protein DsbA
MGKVDQMHAKVFKAIHQDRIRMKDDATVIDWVAKNGIDRASFTNAWNSFGVMTKLRRLPQVTNDYKVDGAPTIVIDGKYQTSPATVYNSVKATNETQLFAATLQVMDALVAKAAKTK